MNRYALLILSATLVLPGAAMADDEHAAHRHAMPMAQAEADYVVAARAIGFPPFHILMREILPNVVPALLALVSLEMGIAVIVEAILSFVGLSVASDTPTWGGMIAEGRQFIHQTWWLFAAPLAALFATVLAFNQLGDGLRRALDPVLRR